MRETFGQPIYGNLIAMASNLVAMVSNLLAMASLILPSRQQRPDEFQEAPIATRLWWVDPPNI